MELWYQSMACQTEWGGYPCGHADSHQTRDGLPIAEFRLHYGADICPTVKAP